MIFPLKHLTIKDFLHTKRASKQKKLDTKKSGKTCNEDNLRIYL
jgi:hypothetical protein